MWFELTGDQRIAESCATEGCGGQPTWRLEAGGIGSNYCSGCKAKIEQQGRENDTPLSPETNDKNDKEA